MKTKLFLLTLLFAAVSSHAAILTVSNDPDLPAQYATLQDAYAAAASNDTLYVYPSNTSYGDLYTYKPLTLIGGGSQPGGKKTRVQNIIFWSGSSGSRISGFRGNQVYLNGPSDIIISRNTLDIFGGTTGGNIIVCQNVIQELVYFEGINSLISNNIINMTYFCGLETAEGLHISNNFILYYADSLKADVISNNIVYAEYFIEIDASLMNNIFATLDSLPSTGDNIQSDNLFTDPGVIALGEFFMDIPPSSLPNLNLADGSPGINAGIDGTDIGLYGGAYPYIEGDVATNEAYRYFPAAAIPLMEEMIMLTPYVQTGASIKVNIQAAKQD